jgi:hypothetical protein
MIVLVSGATKTFRRYQGHPALGHLKTPRNGNCVGSIVESGHCWAADNDAFGDWSPERFHTMLTAIAHALDRSRFLWVACPDVVADAHATLIRWQEWYPQIAYLGLPAAFVGQDGLERISDEIPWEDMAAFFVGGSTDWKLSIAAERFVREARSRGIWTHVGRVNTRKRLRHAVEIGADSIDGTCFSRWPDKYFPRALVWLQEAELQSHFLAAR